MNHSEAQLPLKSVAAALVFSVVLGPLGLLYSSVMGGALMLFLTFTAVCDGFFVAAFIFWMVSCIWCVAATNSYNKKIVNSLSLRGREALGRGNPVT